VRALDLVLSDRTLNWVALVPRGAGALGGWRGRLIERPGRGVEAGTPGPGDLRFDGEAPWDRPKPRAGTDGSISAVLTCVQSLAAERGSRVGAREPSSIPLRCLRCGGGDLQALRSRAAVLRQGLLVDEAAGERAQGWPSLP
jgi:hypothetical protein